MKTFIKMFFTLVIAVCILGAGYYLALTNVSRLLTADKPHWQCRWLGSELLVKTGGWSEVVDLRFPLKLTRQVSLWILQGKNSTLKAITKL